MTAVLLLDPAAQGDLRARHPYYLVVGPTKTNEADEFWRGMLTNDSPHRRRRRFHARIPSDPRCKLCAAPFGGIGGLVTPLLGHRRWPRNPKYCGGCFGMLSTHHGGAEVECSLLFADVRGSTSLAEQLSPMEFTRLMSRFYDTAVSVLVDSDAFVDKFVGDEIIGIFVPAMAGHTSRWMASNGAVSS